MPNWEHIHIEIPISKYWAIYILQICCPLLILATITMFVFLQANGKDDEGSSNIINERVANVIDILLAFSAMIPVFRDSTSKATSFSFFHIIIYISVAPLILALISSVLDMEITNAEFQLTYRPFKDPFFLASFIYLTALLSIVFLVVLLATCEVFSVRQVQRRPRSIKFKKFQHAKEPKAFLSTLEKIKKYRNQQYDVTKIRDVDRWGHPIPELSNAEEFNLQQ